MPTMRRSLLSALAVLSFAACSDDDGTTPQAPSTDSPDPAAATPTSTHSGSPCGVTLADVQSLLPADSGVTESSTPDPGRCNFTWDDGGPRGIDVAIVPGGRSSFEVPADYQPLDGYGEEAFTSTSDTRASAFAFVGNDLYATDVVADSTNTTEADLRDLCLQLLDLALD